MYCIVIVHVKKSTHNYGPFCDKSGNDEGITQRWKAMPFQKGHQKSKPTDEHHMNVDNYWSEKFLRKESKRAIKIMSCIIDEFIVDQKQIYDFRFA